VLKLVPATVTTAAGHVITQQTHLIKPAKQLWLVTDVISISTSA